MCVYVCVCVCVCVQNRTILLPGSPREPALAPQPPTQSRSSAARPTRHPKHKHIKIRLHISDTETALALMMIGVLTRSSGGGVRSLLVLLQGRRLYHTLLMSPLRHTSPKETCTPAYRSRQTQTNPSAVNFNSDVRSNHPLEKGAKKPRGGF